MSYYKVKEFVCPVCGKDFKTKRQLKSHMKDAGCNSKKEKDDKYGK